MPLATWMRRQMALPYSQRCSVLSTSETAVQFPLAMEEAAAHDGVLDLLQCYVHADTYSLAQQEPVGVGIDKKPFNLSQRLDCFQICLYNV